MSESKMQFELGQEVQHKTGGPKMIYVGEQRGNALCSWMANGEKRTATFIHAELKPYQKPPGPVVGLSRR